MKSYEEMAREADALKDTEEEIEGLVPIKARVSRDLRSVYSIRLRRDELLDITNAAKLQGVSISEFIRMGALAAAQGSLDTRYVVREEKLHLLREEARKLYEAVQDLEEYPQDKSESC